MKTKKTRFKKKTVRLKTKGLKKAKRPKKRGGGLASLNTGSGVRIDLPSIAQTKR